jgi:hypothetical protein
MKKSLALIAWRVDYPLRCNGEVNLVSSVSMGAAHCWEYKNWLISSQNIIKQCCGAASFRIRIRLRHREGKMMWRLLQLISLGLYDVNILMRLRLKQEKWCGSLWLRLRNTDYKASGVIDFETVVGTSKLVGKRTATRAFFNIFHRCLA